MNKHLNFLLICFYIFLITGCTTKEEFLMPTKLPVKEYSLQNKNKDQVGTIRIESKSSTNMICSFLDNDYNYIYKDLDFKIHVYDTEILYICQINENKYFFICKAPKNISKKYIRDFGQKGVTETFKFGVLDTNILILGGDIFTDVNYTLNDYYFFN